MVSRTFKFSNFFKIYWILNFINLFLDFFIRKSMNFLNKAQIVHPFLYIRFEKFSKYVEYIQQKGYSWSLVIRLFNKNQDFHPILCSLFADSLTTFLYFQDKPQSHKFNIWKSFLFSWSTSRNCWPVAWHFNFPLFRAGTKNDKNKILYFIEYKLNVIAFRFLHCPSYISIASRFESRMSQKCQITFFLLSLSALGSSIKCRIIEIKKSIFNTHLHLEAFSNVTDICLSKALSSIQETLSEVLKI